MKDQSKQPTEHHEHHGREPSSDPGHAPAPQEPEAPMDHTGHGVTPEEHAGHAPAAQEPDAPIEVTSRQVV